MDIIELAALFAEKHHGQIHQVRKYTGEPYINHPMAVAALVDAVGGTDEMIAAALLHDTVEDTYATIDNIRLLFGDTVAEYVEWLTDISKPSDGNRAIRKKIDRDHIVNAPSEVKTIKLADLIHNTASIVEHDPKFAKIYLAEKRLLLEVLRDGNIELWEHAYEQWRKYNHE